MNKSSGSDQQRDEHFEAVVGRVVAWVEGRLQAGETSNPDWHPDVRAWASEDPDGDDDAPPILLGELMARLIDPQYGGFPPGVFQLRKPANLSQGVQPNSAIRFEWDKSSNVYYYEVEINEDPQFLQAPAHKSNEITHYLELNANTLAPRKPYFWRVIAKNAKGKQAAGNNPFKFTT